MKALWGFLLASVFASISGGEEVLLSDDFKRGPGPGWTWIREHRPAWRTGPAGLEVRIEPGNLWGPQNDARNVLVRDAPADVTATGAFEVRVTVKNKPTHQYEQVNLAWYYDDSHMVKLGQELVDGKLKVVMGREEKDQTRTIAIVPLDLTTVELSFVVQTNRIRGRFRPPGGPDWTAVGECDLPAPAEGKPKLALQFYQGPPDAEHWAEVSGFRVVRDVRK